MPHWEPIWSWEYVLDRTWEFHTRGWSINSNQIRRRERPLFDFVWHSGHQWDDVIAALGLEPSKIRKQAVGQHLSRSDVVARLRERDREGKSLAETIVSRDDLRLINAAIRRFGSYSRALRAAGFRPEKVRLKAVNITAAQIEKLGREMRRVAALHGIRRAAAARALKEKYRIMLPKHLGNWRKACRRFGVKVEDLACCPYASKAHIIEGVRRWASVPGATNGTVSRKDRALQSAACRKFGSWRAAQKAAGVSFPDPRRS
jgi:hypothetical protein